MPTFCRLPTASPAGLRVVVSPQVISGPASSGQQVWMGQSPRSTSSPSMTFSWQGPRRAVWGAILSTSLTKGSFCHTSPALRGGSGARSEASNCPNSPNTSVESEPSAAAIRPAVPNRLPSTAISLPVGRVNSRAGPSRRRVRRQTSVISNCGSTSASTRRSSPRASRWFRNALRSSNLVCVPPHIKSFLVWNIRNPLI